MDPETFREQLTKLHDELRLAGSVDPRSNELLNQIRDDIDRLTQESYTPGVATPGVATPGVATSGVALPAAAASLPDRLERIAVQFEADHPTLAASSRRLVDLLGKVGL